MLYKFYVLMRRVFTEYALNEAEKEQFLRNGRYYDFVRIMTPEEAINSQWIDGDGNRIWISNPCDETSPTFVWGFNNEDDAINFACSLKQEIGIKVEG